MSTKPSRKPRGGYHHGDLRNALLREASRVLATEGLDAVSLRGLARRLGVSHAAPSHHFVDRDALLHELAADGFAALAEALEAALDGDPQDLSLAAGLAYLDVALGDPGRFRLMFGARPRDEAPPPRLQDESNRAYDALLRVARGAEFDPTSRRRDEPMQVEEFATWSSIHGAVMLYLDGALPNVSSEKDLRSLVARMLQRGSAPG